MADDGVRQSIVRKELLTAHLAAGRTVERVDVRQIDFAPGQQTGRRLHPCPVVGHIARGTAHFQIAGGPGETLREGHAFCEPAETTLLCFDNASQREPHINMRGRFDFSSSAARQSLIPSLEQPRMRRA